MPDERHPDPVIRRCQRVLLMVHELHKRGFQLLRIVPGLNASGTAWRCGVTPRSNTLKVNGALAVDGSRMANYSSASKNAYFGWPDARTDTARQLADKFIERFPAIVEESRGVDWEYCGWYVQMMGLADRGAFPVCYSDGMNTDLKRQRIIETSPVETSELPFPPAGDAVDPAFANSAERSASQDVIVEDHSSTTAMPSWNYYALQYLNFWLSDERSIVDCLADIKATENEQIQALRRAAVYFKVARNLSTKASGLPQSELYRPLLKALREIEVTDFTKDTPECVLKVHDHLKAVYKRNVLSLTTKFLWLRLKSPIVILDSQARAALLIPDGPPGSYHEYFQRWHAQFRKHHSQITKACALLPSMGQFTVCPEVATPTYLQQLVQQPWFHERVFDIYLWHVGGLKPDVAM